MKFTKTWLSGVFVIEPELVEDERGCFARSFCRQEFADHGLNPDVDQCSISFNRRQGTLRGLHYQSAPHGEAKLIRCTAGAIYDVAVDLRPESPSYKRWVAAELTAANRQMLYIPEGVAHGFQTLLDGAEVFYQMSAPYRPEAAHGVRWNDPAFGVIWPEAERIISARDSRYPDFEP